MAEIDNATERFRVCAAGLGDVAVAAPEPLFQTPEPCLHINRLAVPLITGHVANSVGLVKQHPKLVYPVLCLGPLRWLMIRGDGPFSGVRALA